MNRTSVERPASFRVWFLASLALALLVSAGCKKPTTIREVLDNAAGLDGKSVRVAGKVVNSAGAMGYGVYQLNDGTATITVVTKNHGVPAKDAEVGVEGTFHSAFTIATDVVAVIEETNRYTR